MQYEIKHKAIDLDDSWDVVVVGGGPAGCAAATAAAREGARTLLLEATGVLGGMGTAGLVPWFCGYSDGERNIAQGLAEHVRLALGEGMPAFAKNLQASDLAVPPIDAELLKRIYDDMVVAAQVSVLFHSSLCSVEVDEDGSILAILVANKAGLTAYKGKVFVDCTGDADLAAWAGVPFEKGDQHGGMQPATLCFLIANIDEFAHRNGPGIHFYNADSPIWTALRSDKYPLIEELHSCLMEVGPGIYGFNTGHVYDVDNTDPENVSKALIQGRKMADQYQRAFAEYTRGFVNSHLVATGSLLGIRETRRIIGDYVLTLDDYRAMRDFEDEICRCRYNIDVHNADKETVLQLCKLSIEELKERNRKCTQPLPAGKSVGVPYRCLTAPGVDNLLVAGRSISTDRQANGAVRIMACCLNTGEAAGLAAALAASDPARDVHAVHVPTLRGRLRQAGAYLPCGGDR